MERLNQPVDMLQLDLTGDPKWYIREKRDVLQFPVSRDIARVRLLNALGPTVYDNSGWILPRVKYSGHMTGDIISIVYSYASARNPTKYLLKGRLLDKDGGSQIVLSVRDDLAWRLLMIPFLAAIVIAAGDLWSGLHTPTYIAAAIGAWILLTALNIVVLIGFSTWQRDIALRDVSRYLLGIVVQPQQTAISYAMPLVPGVGQA